MDNPGQFSNSATIAAIATGPGGAIAIIRLSGSDAVHVAGQMSRLGPRLAAVPPRTMKLTRVWDEDGTILDQALIVRFEGCHSYTGEPMVEIHGHGGRLVAQRILARALACGARPAEAGEFTRRAFLNGKLDLTQAEAVADVIAAGSTLALRLAEEQLRGSLGRRVAELYSRSERVLGEVEAHLDFPEERLDLWSAEQVSAEVGRIAVAVEELLQNRRHGEILRHGVRVVIAGPPNVGKSSLLNALLGRDRAIVTSLPGTTRDTLEESVELDGVPVCLVDTAGIRESPDVIEQDGVARAHRAMQTADLVLWIMDATLPLEGQQPPAEIIVGQKLLTVVNKSDAVSDSAPENGATPGTLRVSAWTGAGLDLLGERIVNSVWGGEPRAEEVCVNARHVNLLCRARQELADARREAQAGAWEICAVALRSALAEVGKVSGKTHTPDILDSIFARFCIGK